ncbi:MAG: TonB-dependent receptor [Lentimicrobium sp.]|nr:TonB-dependent receptor [Lentimicrobium sp.]
MLKSSFFAGIVLMIYVLHPFYSLKAQNEPKDAITLPAVEILDSTINRLSPRTSIGQLEMQSYPTNDIGEMLRMEPNVSGIRRGGYAVDPVIRGFRYSQLNISLDHGIHIEGGCPNRMDPVLAHIDNDMVERIEITRGPYEAAYGPVQGGSVRLITIPERRFGPAKFKVKSVSGFDANRSGWRQHLAITHTSPKLFVKATGGIKDYGNYTDGNGNEWETAYKKRDLSLDMGIKISPNDEIHVAWKGSFGREVMFPALPMDELKDNTHILNLQYTHLNPGKPGQSLDISTWYTDVYHEMGNKFRPQFSQVVPPYTGRMQTLAKVDAATAGMRLNVVKKKATTDINYGIDLNYAAKDGTRHMKMIMEMDDQIFVSQKYFNLWKDAWLLNSGLYGNVSFRKEKFIFNINGRLDYNYSNSNDTLSLSSNEQRWFEVSPQDRVLWSVSGISAYYFNNRSSVKMGLARGARSPDLQERYIKFLATGADSYDYLGNPALQPEVNYQLDLMLDYETNNVRIYANIFRSEVHNFITGKLLPPDQIKPVSMGAPGVKQFTNIDRAVFMGFEAGLGASFYKRFTFTLNAGYTYAYFPEIEKIVLENNQAVGTVMLKNDPIPEIPPFEARLKTTYGLWGNKLQPELVIIAASDQRTISKSAYEKATPGFILFDLGVTYNPFSFASLHLGIKNLTNQAYTMHLNRNIIGSNHRFYEPGRSFYVNLIINL